MIIQNQDHLKIHINKNGTYKSQAGREKGKWKVSNGQLCYDPGGCVKVYKSTVSSTPVYFLQKYGILYTKFTYVVSIENRKLAEEKAVKEKAAEKKAAKDKKLAEEKAAKDKKLAEEKAAKDKKLAEEKAAKEKKLAEEKVAKKELEKKLSLLPSKTDLEKAQNFINILKKFVKQNPDEFDIIELSEFFIAIKPISDGALDTKLKEDLELLKEFTKTSDTFVKHYKILEEMSVGKEVKKIDETIISFEQNMKSIKSFLVDNPESIYLKQWVDDLKKAKNILNNSTSHDELVKENDRLSKVILNAREIEYAKIDAKLIVDDLKEKLRLDLTSDIAPLIIEQVKLLEGAIKKEKIKEIKLSNKIANDFIFKQFEEPKLKAAEEERIAAEKKYAEYKKSKEYKEKKDEEERQKKNSRKKPSIS